MKRELSEILKKGKLTGVEAGRLFLLSTIHKVSNHMEKGYKPLFTDKERDRISKAVPETEENRVALDTYHTLCNALINLHNTANTMSQQALHGLFRALTEICQIEKGLEKSQNQNLLPLPITVEEEEACKKKSLTAVGRKKISISEALLKEVEVYIENFRKEHQDKEMPPTIKERLNAVVTSERLLALPSNLDLITEGGIRFGLLHEMKRDSVVEEARETLRKAYKAKTDMDVCSVLYERSQGIQCRLFADTEGVLDELDKGADRFSLLSAIAEAVWMCVNTMAKATGLPPKEESATESLNRILTYYVDTLVFFEQKRLLVKSFDYIFGFSPLQVQEVPYKKEITVSSVLSNASQYFGGSQENFDEILEYLEGLEPIFDNSKHGRALLKQITGADGRRACSRAKTVKKLAEEGSLYADALLTDAVSQKAIVAKFKEAYPKDPRCAYQGDSYSVFHGKKDPLKMGFSATQSNRIDAYTVNTDLAKNAKFMINQILAPALRFIFTSKCFLRELAVIYEVPELKTTRLTKWGNEKLSLDCLNIILAQILRILDKVGTRETINERRRTFLSAFNSLSLEANNPDEKVFSDILQDISTDPYSNRARFTLERLVLIVMMLSNDGALRAYKGEEA